MPDTASRYLIRNDNGEILLDFFISNGRVAVISIADGIELMLVTNSMKGKPKCTKTE